MRGLGLSGYERLHSDMVAERPTEEGGVGTCWGTFDTLGTLDGVTLAAAFPRGLVGLGACSFPGNARSTLVREGSDHHHGDSRSSSVE